MLAFGCVVPNPPRSPLFAFRSSNHRRSHLLEAPRLTSPGLTNEIVRASALGGTYCRVLVMDTRDRNYQDPSALPASVAQDLSGPARDALNHRTRRCILRDLNRDDRRFWTVDELLRRFPHVPRATVAYHAGVLCECGSVKSSCEPGPGGRPTRSFSSEVAKSSEYRRVLAATEHLDAS